MEKIKGYVATYHQDIFIILLVVTTSFLSFGLGLLAGKAVDKEAIEILIPPGLNVASVGTVTETNSKSEEGEGKYVGSKNSDKYHLPWCSGAQRIAENNKIWFQTIEEAENRGYSPAGNCPGL
ncbi:MAG: hypothetical protein WDZ73_00635 [Candidatus Paceibacterota bacterium]